MRRDVGIDHFLDELGEGSRARIPAELLPCLGRVTKQHVHLGRAKVAGVNLDPNLASSFLLANHLKPFALPNKLHAGMPKGNVAKLLDRVRLACRHHKILRLLVLKNKVHALHVVPRVPPVSCSVQVAERHRLLISRLDGCNRTSDLSRHKRLATAWRLMVEEDTVDCVHAVGLAVVDDAPVGHELCARVGRARVEGRLLALAGLLDLAVELRGRGLVVPAGLLEAGLADCLESVEGADGVDVCRVDGEFKRRVHVALGRQVVELVRLHLVQEGDQVVEVCDVAIVREERDLAGLGILK
mmetsp:Transcript_39689/g.99356  ORF Transcript_39689/g.99356 Transcript_39689/m.99356 type:complete len:299 (-) Transcript_39689:242-1138(-)